MLHITEEFSAEIVVKKSRFIAIIFPCTDLSSIKEKKAQLQTLHKTARHIAFAGVFGPSRDIFALSDDREPKGTAGKPILNVLKGSGATDIAAIVIRYFGGTLLGTGPLARAYSSSVKEALKLARFI